MEMLDHLHLLVEPQEVLVDPPPVVLVAMVFQVIRDLLEIQDKLILHLMEILAILIQEILEIQGHRDNHQLLLA